MSRLHTAEESSALPFSISKHIITVHQLLYSTLAQPSADITYVLLHNFISRFNSHASKTLQITVLLFTLKTEATIKLTQLTRNYRTAFYKAKCFTMSTMRYAGNNCSYHKCKIHQKWINSNAKAHGTKNAASSSSDIRLLIAMSGESNCLLTHDQPIKQWRNATQWRRKDCRMMRFYACKWKTVHITTSLPTSHRL